MFLLTCQDEDAEARRIAAALSETGAAVEVVTASALVHRAVWEHRVGRGGAHTRIALGDGRTIDDANVGAVLNRLAWVDASGIAGPSAADREYATLEWQALVLAWLAGLGRRVLNPPSPPSAGVAWRPPCRWRALARGAGARVEEYSSAGPATAAGARLAVLVIDGRALGDELPEGLELDTGALAAAIGLDVFAAVFAAGGDELALADVDPLPSLLPYTDAAVEALGDALRRRAASEGTG